jgi:uncharacterized protein (TIGR02453 family)
MTVETGFEGFPKDAIAFFAEIKENNRREWFTQNKQRYLDSVQEPAIAFVVALGTRLQALAPEIQFDTATNGSGSVMRIYRDIRFSKDKSPYKDWLGIGLWGGPKKSHHSGIYFGFSNDGGGMHVGSHSFAKEFLAAFRRAVAEKDGARLESALSNMGPGFSVNGEKLKRVPRGFDPESPHADLLRYKSLYVSAPAFPVDLLTNPNLVPTCVENFKQMLPVHRWLFKLGESL